MNVMKRFMAAALLLTMVLCLCACGGSGEEAPETEAPVVETEAPVVTEAPTEAPTEAAFEGYTVTVQDEEGNPIAGAMVQLCMDTCFPSITNESGVATFALDEADYKVSFLSLPAGFTYSTEAQEFYFENGSKELTIVLKAEA